MKQVGGIPNLRHLRMFAAVCELGSINAAAQALHVAQPAITQALAKLEAQLGARLLVRRRAGSTPSAEGALLLSRWRRFDAQVVAALRRAPDRPLAPDAARAAQIAGRLTAGQMLALSGVAASGSLQLAARAMGLSVSALHRATHEMEDNAGFALFAKRPSGLSTTRAGAELARLLRIALREIVIAREEVRSLSGQVDGRILIGSLPMIRSSLLGQAISRTLAQAPALTFEVQEGVYPAMLQALRGGEVDLLIGALRQPAPVGDVEERLLFTDPYAVIARRGHPLDRPGVAVAELAGFEWVVQKPGTPVRAALEAIFAGTGLMPRVAVETSSMSLSRSILLRSDRLCILSRRQIAVEEAAGLLVALPLPLAAGGRPIGLTTRADWMPGQSHRVFLESFYEVLRAEVGGVAETL